MNSIDYLSVIVATHEFVAVSDPDDVITSIAQVRSLLLTLPKSVLTVMRYLFAFLNQ